MGRLRELQWRCTMETMTSDKETGPRAKWSVLPTRIDPEDWATGEDVEPVPGSVQYAEEQRQGREIRGIAERGIG